MRAGPGAATTPAEAATPVQVTGWVPGGAKPPGPSSAGEATVAHANVRKCHPRERILPDMGGSSVDLVKVSV